MYPANGFAIAIIPQAYQRIIAKQIYAIAQPLYFTTQSSSLHGQPWSVPLKTTVIHPLSCPRNWKRCTLSIDPKGAIVLADGVAFRTLSTSVQDLERTHRRLERLYTTAYNRLQTKGDDENDPTRVAD
jgi:hypothetical protein